MSDENTDASNENSNASSVDKGEPTQTETPRRHNPPQDASLEEQLAALKQEQAAFDAKLVAKAIADLEKLIDEVETAKKGYTQADYDALVAHQSALEDEMETLDKALKAALGDEIDEVMAIEATALEEIDAAGDKVEATAEKMSATIAVAEEKAAAMALAKAALDRWRRPADSIEKRQKAASALIEDIKKLRNGPHRGEAYWKLALGDRDRLGAQGFLQLLLKDPPQLVKPDELDGKIETAWAAFKQARAEAVAAQSEYEAAQAAHKAAKVDYDAKTKSIIKTITDALAAREALPAA
ncbi:MAG: hypothetical protein GY811_25585 [Myxococcales bacterium]|nr:hypothetical protein [Myxococcales bacterium]